MASFGLWRKLYTSQNLSKKLCSISDRACRVWLLLQTAADDCGLIEVDMFNIRGGALSGVLLFHKWTNNQIKAALKELVDVGLLFVFTPEKHEIGALPQFIERQPLRRGQKQRYSQLVGFVDLSEISTNQHKSAQIDARKDKIKIRKEEEGDGNTGGKPPCPRSNLLTLYNTTCTPNGLPKAMDVDGARLTHMRTLWAKHPTVEWWTAYFQRVASSPFLCGDNDRGWKTDLTWILKPTNSTKIIEGNFDDRGRGKPSSDVLGILWANKHKFFATDKSGKAKLYSELLPGRPAPRINWSAVSTARDDFAGEKLLKSQLEGS